MITKIRFIRNIEELDGITKFDCDLDFDKLREISSKVKSNAKPYEDIDETERDKYGVHEEWKIYSLQETDEFFPYIESIKNKFKVDGDFHHTGWLANWYFQDSNYFLPEHEDYLTQCSLNFNLGKNPAPVTVNGNDVVYTCSLLNVTKLHSVKNENEERILFKISIYSDTYESYLKRLKEIK